MDFEMKLNSVQNKRKDEEHGSFPFMLYDNEFVPKESLITFLLEVGRLKKRKWILIQDFS